MKCGVALLITVCLSVRCNALDNGLARTPPMGWLTWERFRCNTDCTNDPDNCISEKLIKTMADHMATDGYKEAGYEYIIIDDCWPSHERTKAGQLQPDPVRFPSGIKALADYVHAKGLKFGIYEDFGTKTCAGYPGTEYYMQMDATTFAEWGVDYLKLDGCNSNVEQYADGNYPPMAFYLNRTGRPIYLSCEYPAYQFNNLQKVNYTKVAQACNSARNGQDVQDSWNSVLAIITQYSANILHFAEVAGPGFWNDPDELILGNFGLSGDQERVQMALWAIMASPLIMSTDLRSIRQSSKALLQNKNVIAINQDKLGVQGQRVKEIGHIQIWTKPVMPSGSLAFAYLNTDTGGTPSKVSLKLSDLGLKGSSYKINEVFEGSSLGTFKSSDTFTAMVNPTGVFLGKATPA